MLRDADRSDFFLELVRRKGRLGSGFEDGRVVSWSGSEGRRVELD